MQRAALALLCGLAAPAAALPCGGTIPGNWTDGSRTDALVWGPARPAFTTTWPHGRWTTMNGSFAADYLTVVGHFSNGHVGQGLVSRACDRIDWDDGTSWLADLPQPTIRVHIAPHTHDDVGWDETYMQYFDGNGPLGTGRNVTQILSSVVAGLLEDPARRFVFVEQAYFQLYYETRAPEERAALRSLVAARQLVFLNGGWSMADEASPTYIDLLDNLAVGHRAIAANFGAGALPTATWTIDPFGHAQFTAQLASPLAGSRGVLWGREPADLKAASRLNRALERVWMPSPSLGAAAATFGGVFTDPGYGSPAWNGCGGSNGVETCARAAGVRDAAAAAADIYGSRIRAVRGNDVLLNFGGDFTWENAVKNPADPKSGSWFEYLDGVIEGLNADPQQRFHAFYSTAADYIAAKLAANLTLPALVTDLFPYNDDEPGRNVWSGYFSSRPAFKGYVRETSAVLQSARQLQALVGGVADAGPTNALFALERAMGVAQHHDAISGTARQNVNEDYQARLAVGRAQAFAAIGEAFAAASGYTGEAFAPCELANVTLCASLEAGRPTVAFVYNALGQAELGAPVRLPVGMPPGVASWSVLDADANNVTAQLVPLSARDAALRALYNATPGAAVQWLCFVAASLPPAGYAAFFLLPRAAAALAPHTHASSVAALRGAADANITNGRLTLTVSGATGLLGAYADAATGLALPLAQSWAAYEGFDGASELDGSSQASGAYIFRPARPAPDAIAPGAAQVLLVSGPVVSEAQSELGYVSTSLRLWAGRGSAEVEYTVGPVDAGGNASREVVVRYSSGLASGGAWRSDSNCRESQPRQRGVRGNWTANLTHAPIAGNFYPTTCLVSLSSGATTLALAVDRSQGSASLADGALELMVHRRMRHDDHRGVTEPLDEPGLDGRGLIVRGRHELLLAPRASAPAAAKALAQRALAAPTAVRAFAGLDLAPDRWLAAYAGRASLLRAPLPPNVHLATVHVLNASAWLVRLAHLYEAGEDAALSGEVSVELAGLFARSTVTAAVDMTLPGALPLAAVAPTSYFSEGGLAVTLPLLPAPPAGAALTVTLRAMEIRTLLCTVAPLPDWSAA